MNGRILEAGGSGRPAEWAPAGAAGCAARHAEFTQTRAAALGSAPRPAALWLALTLGLSACEQDTIPDGKSDEPADGGSDGSDGGSAGGPCSDDDECPSGQICEDEVCVGGDRNNSVDEAESLRFGDAEDFTSGTINPAGDVDYFVFEADGGEYIRIATVVEGEDDAEDGSRDTVIRLERANGKPVTSANEFATGTGVTGVDAVMFAYLDEPGLYYVIVEDIGTAIESEDRPPEGGADYRYALSLQLWGSSFAEPDAADSPSLILNLESERVWTSIGALLDEPGDQDHLALELGLDGYDLFLDGNDDLRGSDATPRLRLIDSRGQVWLDKRAFGVAGTGYAPRLPAGSYRVELSDVAEAGGRNHWMFLHTIAREAISDYALEREGNDSLPAAEVLEQEELENSGGNLFTQAKYEGQADGSLDEDWLRFEVDYASSWLVACSNGAVYGALSNPAMELYDASGELIVGAEPTPDASPNALLENVTLTPGTYYLRMAHPEGATGGPGEWYRTVVYVASFEVGGYACP